MKSIGSYKILSLLGTGGMSEVYLAKDTKTGTKVAIKVLDKKLSKDKEYITRFSREIEISKSLSHENIIKIISYGSYKGSYYIVYEYIDGPTLDKYIKSRKLSISDIEDKATQILTGLSYAHSKGVIHRDIKPSNIIISDKGTVKILDFGIAKASTKSTITKTGMFMGSPHYTSPEQIDGKKVDNRTDIYSLGIVLYEMVEGKVPFKADTPLGFVRAHLDKPVPKIKRDIPAYLSDIIYKCLAKKPSDRFSSASEIISVISKNRGTIVKPVEKPTKDSKKIAITSYIVIGVLSIALLIVSILLIDSRRPEPEIAEVIEEEFLHNKIAFDSDRDGDGEIYIMDPDGSNQVQLTDNDSDDWFPSWSPDGTKIAFSSYRGVNSEIYIMDPDGSNQVQLTDNDSDDWFPSWSPDGSKIAFSSYRDRGREICIMDSDGDNQVALTNNDSDDWYPAWSPDGTKIAFSSYRGVNSEIYIIDSDGDNQVALTNNDSDDWYPAWSPDGTKIAFASDRDGDGEIYIMDPDGSNQVQLTDNDSDDWFPSWSRN